MRIPYKSIYSLKEASIPPPMLAHTYNPDETKLPDKIFIQSKLEGLRCVIETKTGKMYTRERNIISSLPEMSKAFKDANITQTEWLDGELYSHGKEFGTILSMVNSTRIGDRRKQQLRFFIFDVIESKPFEARFKIAEKIAKIPALKNFIELTPTFEIDIEELPLYHEQFVKFGFEGTMIRTSSKGYEIGERSSQLLKHKDFVDAEFEIVGYTQEKNTKIPTLGTFRLVTKDGREFGAKPAATQKEREKMWVDRDSYVGKMGTVRYQSLESSGAPQFARFIGVRDYE